MRSDNEEAYREFAKKMAKKITINDSKDDPEVILIMESEHIKNITTEPIKKLVMVAVQQAGTVEKLKFSDMVYEVSRGMLAKKKILSTSYANIVCDVIAAAAFIHNLWYDGTAQSLFKARDILNGEADALKIDPQYKEQIFQMVEAQLGDDTPVERCRPTPNTPMELFTWAVWFVKEYKDYLLKE